MVNLFVVGFVGSLFMNIFEGIVIFVGGEFVIIIGYGVLVVL